MICNTLALISVDSPLKRQEQYYNFVTHSFYFYGWNSTYFESKTSVADTPVDKFWQKILCNYWRDKSCNLNFVNPQDSSCKGYESHFLHQILWREHFESYIKWTFWVIHKENILSHTLDCAACSLLW